MPLIKSGSRQAISTNIREMMAAGHPQKQAIAAAMSTARKYRAEGGAVDDRVAAGWLPKDDAPTTRYPTSDDVDFARQYGHFDINPRSEYLNNQRARVLSGDPNPWYLGRADHLPAKEVKDQGVPRAMRDYYARGALAAKRSALATLGFDPAVVAADLERDPDKVNLLGASRDNEIYANARHPSTLVHESIHRGIDRLKASPFWKPEFNQYDSKDNYNNNEHIPRYVASRKLGEADWNDNWGAYSNPQLRKNALSHFEESVGAQRNKRILDDMEMAASRYMASRNPRGPRALGGPAYASGGDIMPWQERASGRALVHAGMIKSPVPGRTDKLPISVGGGAYVLPADHVAALGQNNSMAGGNILDSMFKMGHFGAPRSTKPRMPRFGLRRKMFAEGGAPDNGKPVQIIAAGGEYVVPPEVVAEIGGGDMDKGHAALDRWVKQTRRRHIKTLRKLKPPKQS